MGDFEDSFRKCQENRVAMEAKLKEMESRLGRAGDDPSPFWDLVREIGPTVRTGQLRDLDRERLRGRLDAMCEQARGRMEESRTQATRSLQAEVAALESMLPDDRKGFWERAPDVVSSFKAARGVDPDTRERLWRRYAQACERAKALSQEERLATEAVSMEARQAIVRRIGGLLDTADACSSLRELGDVGRQLTAVWGDMESTSMERHDLDLCWAAYKAARRRMDAQRSAMLDDNRVIIMEMVGEAESLLEKGELDRAHEMVREAHRTVKLHPLDDAAYAEAKTRLDAVWSSADDVARLQARQRHMNEVETMEARADANEHRLEEIEWEVSIMFRMVEESVDPAIADNLRQEIQRKVIIGNRIRDTNRQLRKDAESINRSLKRAH